MSYEIPITVVMPCFNGSKYVENAVHSILNQSFSDFELIILNDGSTDDSDIKIRNLSDNRIVYVPLKENIGNYPARNIGIKMSRGKYIAVMDADDISNEHRLAIQYEFMEHNKEVACLGSSGILIDDRGEVIGEAEKIQDYSLIKVYLLRDNYTLHPSIMLRKASIINGNLFYNEEFRYAADYDLVVRCAQKYPVINLSDKLIKYRRHSNQISISRFKEQSKFADIVRMNQLNNFGRFSEDQVSAYLTIMKGDIPGKMDIGELLSFFELLVQINMEKKYLDSDKLVTFFKSAIGFALYRDSYNDVVIN